VEKGQFSKGDGSLSEKDIIKPYLSCLAAISILAILKGV
jgi:hypothetical protein